MKKFLKWFIPGLIAGLLIYWGFEKALALTATNNFCMSCHVHPEADNSWKRSDHYETPSGYKVSCAECHLPPKGQGYFFEKAKTGLRDLWSYWTKDSASFDWVERRRLENARNYTYESSCIKCHENLFPVELSKEGADAHLYYKQNKQKMADLHCINCHLNAGHHIKGYTHGSNITFGMVSSAPKEIFTEPAKVTKFESFTEQIPGSSVAFRMIAVSGGRFMMGSPLSEPFRREDEGPLREVEISPFFMGEIEVTWDEYQAFYGQTASEGRTTDTEGIRKKGPSDVDAITGPTPPYGQPDQGWGMGQRPAISFTHYAAETYCKWLSMVTGKTYRLPTEAEWEYACRGGTTTPYFFPGDPRRFQKTGFKAKISKNDTSVINSYVIYRENSSLRTQLPERVKPNPFGLKNMLGNVAEFCSDWYQPDILAQYSEGLTVNPKGPEEGTEHVIRGGSYLDLAGRTRCAARDYTKTDDWLKTDPQMPKSIWWYSDCFYAGFRVVCEYDAKTGNQNVEK